MKKQRVVRVKKEAALWRNENVVANSGHSKRKGELSELAFMCKAVGLGFGVAKPYGDSEYFDFIVSAGRRLWRVQVKSCYKREGTAYPIRTCHNDNGRFAVYTPEEIDVMVVYLPPENAWYVIPIAAIRKRRWLFFHPNGGQRGVDQYERYREAWHLMRDPDASDPDYQVPRQ
jgi:hypothetical protein